MGFDHLRLARIEIAGQRMCRCPHLANRLNSIGPIGPIGPIRHPCPYTPEGADRPLAWEPVRSKPVVGLEADDCSLGPWSKAAVNGAWVRAGQPERTLDSAHARGSVWCVIARARPDDLHGLPQGGPRLGSNHTVDGEPCAVLKARNRTLCPRPKPPVDRARVLTHQPQPALKHPHSA